MSGNENPCVDLYRDRYIQELHLSERQFIRFAYSYYFGIALVQARRNRERAQIKLNEFLYYTLQERKGNPFTSDEIEKEIEYHNKWEENDRIHTNAIWAKYPHASFPDPDEMIRLHSLGWHRRW